MNQNQKIKELTDKIRTELGTEIETSVKQNINQYLTEIEELSFEETEEEKKLYQELGISEKTAENTSKKEVIREVQRLAKLKGIEVNFKEQKDGEIFLPLDQKDKLGNFCPSLVFWNLTQQLATEPDNLPANSQPDEPGKITGQKNPVFWTNFTRELEWVKQNVSNEYFSELETLTIPSLFPIHELEIKKFFSIFYPTSENIAESQTTEIKVRKEIIDNLWQNVKERVLELIKNSPSEEELPKLAFKLEISGISEQKYTLRINYHSQSIFKEKISELMANTPLKLENELLKKEKEQLPTTENFEKLEKQNQAWEREVENLGISEEKFKEIKEKVGEIK